jgi:hypothetical protein
MRQLLATTVLAAAIFAPSIATAQIKTLPGESTTVSATVEAIEKSTRMLTLKGTDGKMTTAQPDVGRFDGEGRRPDHREYYDNVVRKRRRARKTSTR